jgi:hypothetical protein
MAGVSEQGAWRLCDSGDAEKNFLTKPEPLLDFGIVIPKVV